MQTDTLLLASICFVAMISPGPDFILVMRNSLSYPKAQALATAAGIVAGCLIHATYCMLGLALIIAKSIFVFSLIKYSGAAYLMYLGIQGLRSKADRSSLGTIRKSRSVSMRQAFREGFLCNVLNPKCALFLLSLFTQFVSSGATWSDKVLVAGIFVTESAIYWPILVLILQFGGVRSFYGRMKHWCDRVFGGLLLACGFKIALSRA